MLQQSGQFVLATLVGESTVALEAVAAAKLLVGVSDEEGAVNGMKFQTQRIRISEDTPPNYFNTYANLLTANMK